MDTGSDVAKLTIGDDDDFLSGDFSWRNTLSLDRSQQKAEVETADGSVYWASRVSSELVHIVEDANENKFTLLQIDRENRGGKDIKDH